MKKTMLMFVVGITSFLAQSAAIARNGADSKQDKSARPSVKVKTSAHTADTDSCKVTKQEWMNFMAAEFDRLANKNGEIDLSERSPAQQPIAPFSSVGK